MSTRAGIVVTGTEVLTGRVSDRNGPWLAEELRTLGVDVGQIVVVGDRPADLTSAITHLSADHDLVITTGGLGPTADDLTAQIVAEARGRVIEYDEGLAGRIRDRVDALVRRRGWDTPAAELDAGIRKQALVPVGAHVLEPTGTAPGLVVPDAAALAPPVVVLPGPPGELQAMWPQVLADDLVLSAIAGRSELRQQALRIWGPPEAELAAALREHEATHDVSGLEVTTCIRDGELEVVTRHSPEHQAAYDSLETALVERFGAQVYSTDGATLDDVVAELLLASGSTVATAESCTAGLLAARFADRPGSSAYLTGGFVTYANHAKTDEVGVPAELIERVGAVSEEVARAMADGARSRLGTTYGIGVTGVAGPDGGTEEKPVGLVHVCLASESDQWHLRLSLGGGRAAIRQRTVVWALHLLREALAT